MRKSIRSLCTPLEGFCKGLVCLVGLGTLLESLAGLVTFCKGLEVLCTPLVRFCKGLVGLVTFCKGLVV